MIGIFVLVSAGFTGDATAQVVDPHALYEAKCRGCHTEHGADLARLKFAVAGDKLQVTRTGVAVDQLLRKHHGVKLSAEESSVLDRLFKNGIKWGGVFQRRCARCHDNAMTLARAQLAISDGRVKVLKTSADVETFLSKGHGEVSSDEIAALLEMFKYQLATAPKS